MTLLLGGSASPVGWFVCYIEATPEAVADALRPRWPVKVSKPVPYPECLRLLEPLETPWTTEVLIDCGRWTAYLNNSVDGGDPTHIATGVPRILPNARCVVAGSSPRHGPGHAGTQLWVLGPEGEPPLMYERTVSAVAEDGRWKWYESGAPLWFEETERYAARLKKERLNRDVLVRYLAAFGIRADDQDFYGDGIALQRKRVPWRRNKETLAEARERLGLPTQA